MFTGIVTDMGEILSAVPHGEVKTLTIATDYEASGIALGFDRLAMLCVGARRIEDVLWTPVAEPGREKA